MALTTLLSCGLHGCTNVTGGAVELSWELVGSDGAPLGDTGCARALLGKINLHWQPSSGTPQISTFPCTNNRGVTAFDVPKGDVLLWVVPECSTGAEAAAGTFTAPAPVQRTILDGDVVELHAVVIQIDLDHICR